MLLAFLFMLLIGSPTQETVTTCPVVGAVQFSQSYNIRHHRGGRHGGIDIYAKRGTPVVAPEKGLLTYGSNSKGGLTAYLYADEYTYYFAHMDSQGIQGLSLSFGGEAWQVRAGTIIGTVGNTGNAKRTSPHLHFEKRIGEKKRNPYSLLADTCYRRINV